MARTYCKCLLCAGKPRKTSRSVRSHLMSHGRPYKGHPLNRTGDLFSARVAEIEANETETLLKV